MNPHFTLFGLTFYWYGLLMGLAIALVMVLLDYRAAKYDQAFIQDKKHTAKKRRPQIQQFFQQWSMVLLIGGFVGARLWHVATDWQLYRTNWREIASLSHGGLSILGAILGGVISLWLLRRFVRSAAQTPALLITDLLAICLPFGQAFGRMGNWINQELYGLPSDLPWAITIAPEYRLPEYFDTARYHPLFMYEALIMVVLGVVLWGLSFKQKKFVGSGFFIMLYLTIYSLVRFCLDFLRLDRPVWRWGLGVNQLVLGLVFLFALGFWIFLMRRKYFSLYATKS